MLSGCTSSATNTKQDPTQEPVVTSTTTTTTTTTKALEVTTSVSTEAVVTTTITTTEDTKVTTTTPITTTTQVTTTKPVVSTTTTTIAAKPALSIPSNDKSGFVSKINGTHDERAYHTSKFYITGFDYRNEKIIDANRNTLINPFLGGELWEYQIYGDNFYTMYMMHMKSDTSKSPLSVRADLLDDKDSIVDSFLVDNIYDFDGFYFELYDKQMTSTMSINYYTLENNEFILFKNAKFTPVIPEVKRITIDWTPTTSDEIKWYNKDLNDLYRLICDDTFTFSNFERVSSSMNNCLNVKNYTGMWSGGDYIFALYINKSIENTNEGFQILDVNKEPIMAEPMAFADGKGSSYYYVRIPKDRLINNTFILLRTDCDGEVGTYQTITIK